MIQFQHPEFFPSAHERELFKKQFNLTPIDISRLKHGELFYDEAELDSFLAEQAKIQTLLEAGVEFIVVYVSTEGSILIWGTAIDDEGKISLERDMMEHFEPHSKTLRKKKE